MLDIWFFSTFCLRMPHLYSKGFRSGDILCHSITFTFSSKAVVILVVCLGWLCWKTVSEGRASPLLQNVTVLVGIHVSLNEPQLPSTSSSHAAPDHDATTACLSVGKAQFSWYSSPGYRYTCWTPSEPNKALRLIRPQEMVPVMHALGQVVFSKLFAGFFESQLQKRLPSGTTAMQNDLLQCVAYGLSTDKLTFHYCNL